MWKKIKMISLLIVEDYGNICLSMGPGGMYGWY